jgi:hypothetical protein
MMCICARTEPALMQGLAAEMPVSPVNMHCGNVPVMCVFHIRSICAPVRDHATLTAFE